MNGHGRTITSHLSPQKLPASQRALSRHSATPDTMNIRQVLFVALVGMAVAPAFGGDALKSKLAEALAADKPAATLANTLPQAVVANSEPPCNQICKNVCKVDMVKSCSTVPVTSKVCTPTKKTLSKQVCSKKCTLSHETPKFVKGPSDDTSSTPNPSTPPTNVASAAASAGRRLSGLIAADLAVKTVLTAEVMKSLPMPACGDVCETVSYEVPDLECHEVTQDTEVCKMVPVNNCHQECVCKPYNTLAAKMAKKAPDTSVNEP